MTKKKLESIILDYIHVETGWGNPLRPYCEFEDLIILEIIQQPEGLSEVVVKYRFDEDGFSQYDKSHTLEGRFVISSSGEVVKVELEETYTGPATVYDPYRPDIGSDSQS
ncbi:MAG: hypothetical protein ACFFDM_12965 [Candidatus Thorarchaeota archaeon]